MHLGKGSPAAIISLKEGQWRLEPLVLDAAANDRRYQESMRSTGMWVPEMAWPSLKPGEPIISVGTREEFVAKLEALSWTYG
ncbi:MULTISPECIES: hypothetical protein [unclassified Corallococcus]|uniref:hypothetical protein n=1 Tax=unclassified Corallococcus TaxID=2685029 RepID=UPI001A8EFDE7|nr:MULTISPECIES: hypothetical protein [unclassified Corallococcus]MBN9685602.1 hypothetical protein [Corallococcus sp. NCSPR001]WAS82953.1 hypothetical protein O0N60_26940 [Corallococcus sp. NCRR]